MMTSRINGGINGLVDRTTKFEKAVQVLGCGAITKGGKAEPTCTDSVGSNAKCLPLCGGLTQKSYCGCSGAQYTGKCPGPSTVVCCKE